MNEWSWTHVITYTNLFQNISMWSYLLRCRLQKRPHLFKKKKSLPTLPNFFGVVTLNTHIFLFGPTKHAKHFEKMAELTADVKL